MYGENNNYNGYNNYNNYNNGFNTYNNVPENRGNKGKAFVAIVFVLILAFGIMYLGKMGPFKDKEEKVSNVDKIQVSRSDMKINVGETRLLSINFVSGDAGASIEWNSSDESVATVYDGLVTAFKAGTTVITAKVNGTLRVESTVVVEGEAEDLLLSDSSYALAVGEAYTLIATAPDNEPVSWVSSNPSIVSVVNGEIKGVREGTATVTASTSSGGSVECFVVVSSIPLEEILFKSTEESITIGGVVYLELSVLPTNATNKEMTWSSSDNSVATVSNGIVTGKKVGTTTITAASGDKSASATIHVVSKAVGINSISIKPSKKETTVNNPVSLTATVSPKNATNKTITWSSSDNSIATVDNNGLVRPKKTGTVKITAKAGGKSATATITIKGNNSSSDSNNTAKVTGVTVDKQSLALGVGSSDNVTAIISPNNAANKNLTWSSSDNSVATVSANSSNTARVTGKSVGTATITVKTADGGYTKTIGVTVSATKVTRITLSKTSVSLSTGGTTTVTATTSPVTKNVTWSSSNNAVATVANGTIKGVKAGSTTVKATVDGVTATVSVTVHDVPATGISIKGSKNLFYTNYKNSSDLTTTLSATVLPNNASSKSVTWSSSDTSIATVDSTGKVTVKKKIGTATITARTGNGKSATYTITVRKKILIVITASQGMRMYNYYKEYSNSSLKMDFKVSDGSLIYKARSGSGVCFQAATTTLNGLSKVGGMPCLTHDIRTGEDYTTVTNKNTSGIVDAVATLNSSYASNKTYVEPYVIYTLPGNSIKAYTCNQINLTRYTPLATAYDKAGKYIRDTNGYSRTKIYMVSHFPVRSSMANDYYDKQGTATSNRKVVSSSNSHKCEETYISASKYYRSNNRFKKALSDVNSTVKFVDTFARFLIVKDEAELTMKWNPDKPFDFTISDSLHMDKTTTQKYTPLMFDMVLSTN